MSALISKPGLTGASVLNIPKDWTPSWFRGIIDSLLKGGDVRNAIAGPGITITGNISSPYATIGVGGSSAAPITGPVTINGYGFGETTGTPLTIKSSGENLRFVVNASSTQSYMDWYESDNTTRRGYFGFGNVGDETMILDTDTSTGKLSFRTKALARMEVLAVGTVTVGGVDAGNETMQITGTTGGSALRVTPASGLTGLFIPVPSGSNQAGIVVTAAAGGVTRAMIQLIGNGGLNCFIGTADGAGDLATGTTAGDLVIRVDTNGLFLIGAGGVQVAATGQTLGFYGATPVAKVTGFGTPVGGAVVASYNITDAGGANSNTNKCVAEILTILKSIGLIGA